ncbi:MAG: GNAT family N-acetyltransferase [Halobacteriota archaeon]
MAEPSAFRVSSRPGEPDALTLSHERFPFAGRFGRRRTGTALLEVADEPVAAVAFSPDRADAKRYRVRYWAVRRDRQGEGLGRTLIDAFAGWALGGPAAEVAVGAESPHAAVALDREGYGPTDERGPRGEVVFVKPAPDAGPGLETALEALLELPLTDSQRRYIRERRSAGRPPTDGTD